MGDGRREDADAIQAAYDSLVAKGGGTLLFPAGTYATSLLLTSRTVAIVGEGPSATRLIAVRQGVPIMRAGFGDASWDLVGITGLTFDGLGLAGSRGFVFGYDDGEGLSPFIGRVSFDAVGFSGLHRAIVRPSGNIGVHIDRCRFSQVGIAVDCHSIGPGTIEMHAGTMSIKRAHFSGFSEAAIILESKVPGGQILIEDSVFENAVGFLLFITEFNAAGPTPGITLRRCWIENVATGTVVVRGESYAEGRCILAHNCSCPIVAEDTPIGDVELRGTTLITDNCSLDALSNASLDEASQLIHYRARQFSGLAPGRCVSIVRPSAMAELHTPWFRMTLPKQTLHMPAANKLMVATEHSSLSLTGTRLVEGTMSDDHPPVAGLTTATTLEIPANTKLFHSPMAPIGDGSFIVALYLYRLVVGEAPSLEINGLRGLSGLAPLTDETWQLLANISRCNTGPAESQGLMIRGGGRKSTILVAGAALLSFTNLDDAVVFINSGMFPS